MLKPASLRAHLSAATPELQRDPDKLSVYVSAGKLIARGGASISFEYRYTLELTLLDFRSHPDSIMVPMLAWLKRNQPEIFEHPELREKSIRFECEMLNHETFDLTIELNLTEIVSVVPGSVPGAPDTTRRYTITHVSEPAHVGVVSEPEHWTAVFDGQTLAEWTFAPPQD